MKVLIVGSVHLPDNPKDQQMNEFRTKKKEFIAACKAVGGAFASKDHTIMVGVTDWEMLKDGNTVASYVVEGASEVTVKDGDLHPIIFVAPNAQEPPDATIVTAVAQGHDGIQVIESILRRKPILKNIQTLLGTSEQTMKTSLNRFYQQSKSMKEGDSVAWFKTYWRTYDSWGIGVNIVVLLIKLSIWPKFSMDSFKTSLFPILRKMCAVSPLERIDCVQALHQLEPNHFILQRYGKEWLKKVGTGN